MSSSEYTPEHAASQPDTPPLEAWPNQYADRRYEISITHPEFTCLCPRTGLPDFATISIKYTPDQQCLELKSLKYYLNTFRQVGIFHENVVNRVRDDIVAAIAPHRVEVEGAFSARGGILTTVRSVWQREES